MAIAMQVANSEIVGKQKNDIRFRASRGLDGTTECYDKRGDNLECFVHIEVLVRGGPMKLVYSKSAKLSIERCNLLTQNLLDFDTSKHPKCLKDGNRRDTSRL